MNPRSRLALGFAVACAVVGLGGGCTKPAAAPEAPKVPLARKVAVGKMVRAVEQARRPDMGEGAIRLLSEAVAEDPELWEARFDLGVLLAARGELSEARTELEKAYELAPNAEDVVAALAEVLRRLGEIELAASTLARFVERLPTAAHARRVLIGLLRELDQADGALVHARELVRQRPFDASALAELALAHLERGEVDIAELLAREALKSKPKAAVVERAAGLIALERGEDAVAFVHFAKATQLDPKDTAAGLNTATVLLQAGVFDRAEKHFRAVLSAEPGSDDAKLGLAAALRGQGSRDRRAPYEQAEQLLKEILAKAPGHWAAAHNLAVLYAESLARSDDATTLYSQFLKHAPAGHPARERAQRWVDDHTTLSADPQAEQ